MLKTRSLKRRRMLQTECFEPRVCLSATTYVEVPIVEAPPQNTLDSKSFDINGDGHSDVLASFENGNRLAWFENTRNDGAFQRGKTIDPNAGGVRYVFAGDLDGDNDLDVIVASRKKVAWYANLDGQGRFSFAREIAVQEQAATFGTGYQWAQPVDMDLDGDLDLVTHHIAPQGGATIAWHENQNGLGDFSSANNAVASAATLTSASLGDLDRDGDIDVIAARSEQEIIWFEQTDLTGVFGEPQFIADGRSVLDVGDVDSDDDLDVVFEPIHEWQPGDSVFAASWIENTDANGSFGSPRTIGEANDEDIAWLTSGTLGDLDQDGDLDLLAIAGHGFAMYAELVWYENIDGLGDFQKHTQLYVYDNETPSVSAIWIDDLDDDGAQDALYATTEEILWRAQAESGGFVGRESRPIVPTVKVVSAIHAGNLGGDNRLDVLSGQRIDDMVVWFKNSNGEFELPRTITGEEADATYATVAADVDGDDDDDIIVASYDGSIVWFENLGADGVFAEPQVITSENTISGRPGTMSMVAADIDGDGDIDIASGSDAAQVVWFENLDGLGNFGAKRLITTESARSLTIATADLDSDGKLDVLTLSSSTLRWFKHLDGTGTFASSQLITNEAHGVTAIGTADLNNNGMLDIVSTAAVGDIVWFEHTNGRGAFAAPRVILPHEPSGVAFAMPTDFDGDGDVDMLSVLKNEIAWQENLDGQGIFGSPQIVSATSSGESCGDFCELERVHFADIDFDGDLDIVSALQKGDFFTHNTISLFENRVIGDSDDDGIFSSSDLVVIFQEGKYDGPANSATFDEGDWNQDGRFDSADFVFALQSGNYAKQATPITAGIAAAIERFSNAMEEKKSRAWLA